MWSRRPSILVMVLSLAVAGCGEGAKEVSTREADGPTTVAPETPIDDRGAPPDVAPPRRGVTGRVTSDTGEPVSGALMEPRSLDEPAPAVPELAVLSDAEGKYFWDLPAGRWALTAKAEGFRPASATVAVGDDAVATLDFTLQRTS
jgi:carboxypeptidase family protein